MRASIGLKVTGTTNFFVRNTASGNPTNYSIGADKPGGPVISNPAGNDFGPTNAWSDFSC